MIAEKRRIKLLISFDGTHFSGWQRQKHDITIQGEIENCLCKMTREDLFLHGAGRTDKGVHALGMVAHFDSLSTISCQTFTQSLNSMLPGAIRIIDAVQVTPDFHSRFSAKGKVYQYTLYRGKVQPPHKRLYTVHIKNDLDIVQMSESLDYLEGTHDFSSFENSGSRDKTITGGRGAVRTIFSAQLVEPNDNKDTLVFEFTGDGFLRNMVRNMVGLLLEVGRRKISSRDFIHILEEKNRSAGGPTAPAHGLFLKQVLY